MQFPYRLEAFSGIAPVPLEDFSEFPPEDTGKAGTHKILSSIFTV
jgi:hypothetical protein